MHTINKKNQKKNVYKEEYLLNSINRANKELDKIESEIKALRDLQNQEVN